MKHRVEAHHRIERRRREVHAPHVRAHQRNARRLPPRQRQLRRGNVRTYQVDQYQRVGLVDAVGHVGVVPHLVACPGQELGQLDRVDDRHARPAPEVKYPRATR